MLEQNILFSLLLKENYNNYRNYLKTEDFSVENKLVLKAIDKWHHNQANDLSLQTLVNVFFAEHPDKQQAFAPVFQHLGSLVHESSVKGLLESFKRQKILESISVMAYEAAIGQGDIGALQTAFRSLEAPVDDSRFEFVDWDLDRLLDENIQMPGLRWRLGILNKSLGSLRKGDFGFFFARPETGKTAMLASEITYMSTQLRDDDGPILYFNNEERGDKIAIRMFQAALGLTTDEIEENRPNAKKAFLDLTRHNIKIRDEATTSRWDVDATADRFKPSLIVFDQLDKIYGFSSDREDLRMGQIYVWARELAKRYCPVIGVCQADGSADGQRYLTLSNVSNSKTSKAAEADFIVGIGSENTLGSQNVRGLSVLKNKLLGDATSVPEYRHGKWDVLIRPAIQRFIDID